MVKRFIPVLLLFAAVPFLMAENRISIDMELYNTVYRTRDLSLNTSWAYGIAGKGSVSFKSMGNKSVRADLVTDITFPDSSGIPLIILKKAYIKAKFPSFRVTLGKTRLGWGDGFVFNSGDVIFGSTSPYVDLTHSEIRGETAWINSLNYPLGRFSFVEGVVKIPDPGNLGLGEIEDSGAGLRFYTKAGGVKIEAGYFFDGTDISSYDILYTGSTESINFTGLHRPYLSLQGNIGPDWYINSSAAVPFNNSKYTNSVLKDTFSISFGLFHMAEAGYNNSITLRLEASVLPFLSWDENIEGKNYYAILVYPEISLNLGTTVSLSLRSIISPVDLSAQITSGLSWNVFEGLNIITYTTVNAGDKNDTFAWSKSPWNSETDAVDGISIIAGIKYIY